MSEAAGGTFTSTRRTITETDVVLFASLTGDRNPLHVDAVAAAESPFGERVAHGLLTLAYSVGLVPMDDLNAVALRKLRDVVFKKPVLLGDTIQVRGQIEGVSPAGAGRQITSVRWTVVNQRDEIVMVARVDLVTANDEQ